MLAWKSDLREAEARIAALETENRGYTDIVTSALVEAAADAMSDGYIAALEIAAGQLSRAFASATVSGPGADMFTSETLAQIGRSMVENGEAVYYRQGMRLFRADNYGIDTDGGVPIARYTLSLPGRTVAVEPDRVFHARWAVEYSTGRGVGPLATARTLRTLMQRLETSLMQESGAAVGYLLPIPEDGASKTVTQLRTDLANLKGKVAVVQTTAGGWDTDPGRAPRKDYELSRIGPDYPASSIELFQAARNTVLAACGYPVQLVSSTDGTGQREGWRRYLHGTVQPLGRIIEAAAVRIGYPITLEYRSLMASDIAGRARAFKQMVDAGLPLPEAAAQSGLLDPES